MTSHRSAPELASELDLRLLDLERQLVEHQARAASTAEILRAIEDAKGDTQPVFDRIAHSAAELCAARFCMMWRYDGRLMHYCSSYGFPAEFMQAYLADYPQPPTDGGIVKPAVTLGRVAQIEDAHSDDYADNKTAKAFGYRRMTAVPIHSGNRVWGCIVLGWPVTEAPSSSHLDLMQSFAEQASIAIENARLFHELQDSLEKQEATSDILRVISQSHEDEARVFDLVLEKATVLCNADQGSLQIVNEARTLVRLMANRGHNRAAYHTGLEFSLDQPLSIVPTIRAGIVVHIEDYAQSDAYRIRDPIAVELVETEGVRTRLNVPLLQNGIAIGCIAVSRRVVRPFSQAEIALVETFAAQAVIAIENARQFRELQTRLAREAATREILEVISQSRDDERPVFDVIARSAARLCGASICTFWRVEDDLIHYCASHGLDSTAAAEAQSAPAIPLQDNTLTGQVKKTRAVAQIDDPMADSYHDHEWARALGVTQTIGVPIFAGDEVWGCICLHWQGDRAPRDADIQLVESFAAQASIAIENVRQFRELQTRLAREAATREILEVISQSRDDERPVFDVVLRKAAELCDASMADFSVISEDRTYAVLTAAWGDIPMDVLPVGETVFQMDQDYGPSICLREGRIVHIHDLADTDAYRSGDKIRVAAVDEVGIKTLLGVPMFSGGKTISCMTIYRREIRPFSADEISLVETFAAQAVIAIENVRQFRELQSRLEREKASAEILEVISQSRDDEKPVFDAVLRNAVRLCGASSAGLLLGRKEGPHLVLAALHEAGAPSEEGSAAFVAKINRTPMRMDPAEHISAQAICDGAVVQVKDLAQSPSYLAGEPTFRSMVEEQGIRAVLSVPLKGAEGAIGAINLHWSEPRSFSPDEISLAETFAAQAVIAIENVRQFSELQTRLEREKASAEILEVISQSRDDEKPVFDVVLRKAAELCHAPMASLLTISEDRRHALLTADWGLDNIPGGLVVGAQRWPLDSDGALSTCMLEGQIAHIHDLADTDQYRSGHQTAVTAVDVEGIRTLLAVPLFRGGGTVGCILVLRPEVKPFAADEIALVETFAAQAVIAIENVRQFRELQKRLAREAATREILEVISHSREDERPVFDVVLRKAAELCGASMASLIHVSEDRTHAVAFAEWGDHVSDQRPVGVTSWPMSAEYAPSTCLREGRIVHIPDLADTDLYRSGDTIRTTAVDVEGIHTFLSVPLFSGGQTVSCLSIYRKEVRPFNDDEITLVETFAAQAVIAIENVRQFRALQDRLAREAATREVLRVISESPDDEQPTFEVILDNATRLCGTQYASLVLGRRGDASQRMVAHRSAIAETVAVYRDGKVPMDAEDSIGARAILQGITIHVPDMADTDQYRNGHARFRMVVDQQGLRTNLFVPLMGPEGGIGCFILWKKEVAPFTADQIALMETFASHAVIAIENVRQFKALEALNAELGDRVQDQVGEIERMGRLKRFLPAAVADTVISSGSEKMLSSHRALLGVLFCDIRGFTAFCETAEPEETIEVLQTYHEEMGKLINAHGAGVDHRMGDGIMVLFNDPLPCEDPAGEAVRLAIAMHKRMGELGQKWKRLGHRLGFGVGISLGYATVGMVGFEGRFDYTASGTAINLASRLCDEALDGEVLLSPRAGIAVEDRFQIEPRGVVTLKGIREPVEVFRLTDFGAA